MSSNGGACRGERAAMVVADDVVAVGVVPQEKHVEPCCAVPCDGAKSVVERAACLAIKPST